MAAQSDESDSVVLPDRHSEEYDALRRTVCDAVEHGDVQTLQAIGARVVQHVQAPGSPMFVIALKHRQVRVVEWAVEESKRTGISIARDWKDVHLAAYRGDVDTLKATPDKGLSLRTGWGAETVLHVAAMGDQAEAIEYLVRERGVDVQAVNDESFTAQETASEYGSVAAIEALVACGARLQHSMWGDPLGRALVVAARNGQVTAMEKLVQLGVDASVVQWGSGLLHAAVQSGCTDAIDAAVRLGADPRAAGGGLWTALHTAVELGKHGVVGRLVHVGVPIDGENSSGQTALHCARSSPEACRALLELGADRWIKDKNGQTARDWAVCYMSITRYGSEQVVELLDTYWPIVPGMMQLLLGLKGPSETSLTRFAAHSAFEPKVLSLVNCLLVGKEDKAFEQLVGECSAGSGDGVEASSSSSSPSSSSRATKKQRQGYRVEDNA